MALSQAERIEISKKIIDIPLQNAAFDRIKNTLDQSSEALTNEDNANKSLMDDLTALITPYQSEFTQLDGNVRVTLTEQMVIDSANKVKQNFFFPNDPDVLLPNVPDGIWKFFPPFSGNVAIGRNYDESFTTTDREQDKIDAINAQVAIVEAASDAIRSTGLECTSGMPSDSFAPEPVIQQAVIDITAAVNDWRAFLVAQQGLIPTTDPDTGRQTQNNTAIADITNAISIIDTWLALVDFDTTTTIPITCPLFDASVPGDFVPSKLRSIELQVLKDEITDRQSFITTRISQLNTNLGTVGQDLSTGEINNSGSGLYDDRFKSINIRLNLLGGSLNKKLSTENGKAAQDALKATNDAAADLYQSVMKVSIFVAPASNNGTIHVENASEFSIGDTIYVVAESQSELTGTISNIDGNTVFLDISIPEKYTHENRSRLYKLV